MVAVATPIQTPPTGGAGRQVVPFRRGTIERVDQLVGEAFATYPLATQRIERTIEGSGFVYGIVLDFRVVTAANAAAVAYTEDAPWAALDTVVLRDVNGELVNLTGFDLLIANLAGAQYSVNFPTAAAISALFSQVAGAVGTGGSFTFLLRVPVGINRRDLVGILGNQDRAQKYSLRTDVAPNTAIYTVNPTTQGATTLDKFYESYAVPLAVGPLGQAQQQLPDAFGTFHFLTAITSEAVPLASSRVNHYLRRIGNSVRFVALVFRAGAGATPRATAEATPPTNIRFKIGEDTLFTETYRYRRFLMFERYGFDFPAGILVYDAMHDMGAGAGDEVGDDYWNTQAVNNAQFEITYSAAFVAGSSVRIITDDLQPGGVGPMVG